MKTNRDVIRYHLSFLLCISATVNLYAKVIYAITEIDCVIFTLSWYTSVNK